MNSKLSNRARASLIAGLLVPLFAYLILRQAIGSITGALAITEAIPVAWMTTIAFARRRLEPVALISVVVFGFALAITVLSGGSSLPLKLRRGALSGVVGVACLVSVALRKPLLIAALPLIARTHPERRAAIDQALHDPDRRHTMSIATVIAGLTFVADAAVQIALALTVSTTTVVATARVVRLAILAAGGVVLVLLFAFDAEDATAGHPSEAPTIAERLR